MLNNSNDLKPLYSNIPWHVQAFASRARIGNIITNTYLYRFNLTESPMCPLCQVEEEDLEHIFLGCASINCHKKTMQYLLPETLVQMLQYILSTPMLWTIAELIYSLHKKNHHLALQEAYSKCAMYSCHQLRLDIRNEE